MLLGHPQVREPRLPGWAEPGNGVIRQVHDVEWRRSTQSDPEHPVRKQVLHLGLVTKPLSECGLTAASRTEKSDDWTVTVLTGQAVAEMLDDLAGE
jgi:hypothetical protein